MSGCDRVRVLIPWYASGSLSVDEARDVAEHLAQCEACRVELSDTLRLRMEVERAIQGMPGLSSETWTRVVERTHGEPIARLDVGSFLIGFSLGASIRRGAIPVRADLRLLGHRIRLFNVGKGGRQ